MFYDQGTGSALGSARRDEGWDTADGRCPAVPLSEAPEPPTYQCSPF